MIEASPDPVYFLLVDDLEENLLALQALLRRDGLVLLTARSGTEALELLLKHDVALAFVDVQMPGMDGFELAELMRGAERTRRVPIIFLTAATADRQRRFRGYEAGAVDFLQKPIEPDILRNKAEVFSELFRQRQEVTRQRDELKIAAEKITQLLIESRSYAAALQEADRRKDEFLAVLAHELRNPLAPIRNAVEFLRAKVPPTPDLVWARDVIDRQAEQLSRLVDDLLDVSRVSRGKIELRRETVPLRSVVESAIEASRPLIDSRRHELIVDIPAEQVLLHADPTRLSQILMNLLNNAAKYMDGGGRIWLIAEQQAENVTIRVKDAGVGISAAMLPRIFEIFTQVDSTLERSEGGLGIGLTLVKRLVELHGGTVHAHSEGPGQGSEFIVRLPIAPQQDVASQAASAETQKIVPLARHRILVVDDNRDSANSLAMLLRVMGHEVRTAFDGLEALEVIGHFRPETVLMDIGLPKLNGYDAARRVRTDFGSEIVLIALTGWGQEDDRRRSKEAGFDFHLTKPVELGALQEMLASRQKSGGPPKHEPRP
ncbi:MAG TPA: response regulator [Planctomycetaceae bacterium]|jgi:signal transduction histidine kinase